MIKKISSLTNDQIKAVCDLHHAKYRAQRRLFIAEGIRIINTLLEAGKKPVTLYITPEQLPTAQALNCGAELVEVTMDVMKKMSAAHTPSGILGVFHIPLAPQKLHKGVVLAQIADPGNMGTLIRSAAAFGAKSVVIVEGCDPWSPKVMQASAGTIAQVAIHELSWDELVATKGTLSLCALVVSNGKKPEELNLKNALMVIGNEAQGLPADWVAQCELQLTLPMLGNTESLNAAVAGSIALYLAQENN